MGPVSELARERETLRYDASLIASSVIAEDGPLPPSSSLTSSSDTILTALAQLITVRLGVARALISLFDHKYQYVVAEATPCSPLAAHAKYDGTNDGLWLCGTATPRSSGICEHVFDVAAHELGSGGSGLENLPLFIIPDIHKDSRFRDRSACQSKPNHRFYAGVPIRSSRGIDIGVLCVYDDRPRTGLDATYARVMRDVSNSIMDHWESKRSRAALNRSQRMVRGIGSFVEGKSTLAAWQHSQGGTLFDTPGLEGALNANQQTLQHRQSIDLGNPESPAHAMEIPMRPAPIPVQAAGDTTGNTPSFILETTASHDSMPVHSNDSIPSVSATFNAPAASTQSRHIKHIFSRAGNVIRESIEVEGVVFVDATVRSFGGFRARENSTGDSGASVYGDSSSEGDAASLGEASLESVDDVHCPILGFSTSNLSTIDQQPTSSYKVAVSERLLLKLIKRYPEGKIFSFDENGAIQSSDSSSDSGRTVQAPALRRRVPRPFSKQSEGKAIIQSFPGARNVALVPIWDMQKQRWSAAGFVYTMNPLRQFTKEGELSYLRGFSSIIMAEVVRTETTIADHAKGDALSSLSHELRSPLHGIVLGTELLADTHLDAYQGNVLHTVETCGRTLLDSIDHLLDYSKINNFMKMSRRQGANTVARGLRQNKMATVEAGMMSLASDIQLDVLVEEVIESLFLGHNFHHLSIAQWEQGSPSVYEDVNALRRLDSMRATENLEHGGNERGSIRLPSDGVFIFLDIDPKDSWLFHGQSGAIRRILMNVFGNALKYTSSGMIKVSLQQETLPGSGRHSRRIIRLVVEDTGRGMSEDYLRNHLYHAFSQENSLDPGIGLGLSLVKQITSSLGGMIKVDSRLGIGTTVSVSFPMSLGTSPSAGTTMTGEQPFTERVERLKGLRVLLYGFANVTDSKTQSPGVERRINELMLKKVCEEWLQMDVITPLDNFQFAPDLILCSETSLDRLLEERQTRDLPPTVTICQNVLHARDLASSFAASDKRGVFEFVTQPMGPRKLSKILLLCFNRWLEAQSNLSVGGSVWLSPSAVPQSDHFDVAPSSDYAVESSIGLPQPFLAPSALEDQTLDPRHTTGADPSSTESLQAPPGHKTPTPQHPGILRAVSYIKTQELSRNMFLVVDDNAINRIILETYLKKLEHPFSSATNGKEAYDSYIQSPSRFHCIFMDISMPVMDGFEASRLIRKFERERQLHPVVIFALTGLASAEAQQEALASGIDLFLTKPVRLKELTLILSQHGVS